MGERELFQQYVKEVSEWGTQVEQILLQRDDGAVHRDIAALLSYIDKHEGEWTEADIYDLQRMVDEAYEKATAIPANDPLVDEGEEIGEEGARSQTYIAAGRHVLPPLPYSYDALEPHISKEIMQLHHTKHHQSYVDGLNKAEKMMKKARETNNYESLKHWEREAAFHGSGHYLHTIFWNNMHPKGGGEPSGELLEQIKRDFGSFERFKRHFTEAAKSVEGVGWALLVWAPRSHRLEILQTEKHQFMTQWDTIPLLVLDVWEHAYYLQYKSDRAAYINSWWNVVHWRDVEERFAQAQNLRWKPF